MCKTSEKHNHIETKKQEMTKPRKSVKTKKSLHNQSKRQCFRMFIDALTNKKS